MFRKMVAVEPINTTDRWLERLRDYARDVVFYKDRPASNDEIIRRIGDADALLVSYTTDIDAEVLAVCKNLRYVGMCCSLYAPENANVDIRFANAQGIAVKGVRDYGDEGVPEYVVSELVRLLHGFGDRMWREYPMELTDIDIGILGLGTNGQLVARALKFFGANVFYYSRTKKEEIERAEGYRYLPMNELLETVDILCCCLNKNVILLGEREFSLFGDRKIVVNTSIGPAHDIGAAEAWLKRNKNNYLLGDTKNAVDPTGRLFSLPNVISPQKSSGASTLSRERLGQKMIENIEQYFAEQAKN